MCEPEHEIHCDDECRFVLLQCGDGARAPGPRASREIGVRVVEDLRFRRERGAQIRCERKSGSHSGACTEHAHAGSPLCGARARRFDPCAQQITVQHEPDTEAEKGQEKEQNPHGVGAAMVLLRGPSGRKEALRDSNFGGRKSKASGSSERSSCAPELPRAAVSRCACCGRPQGTRASRPRRAGAHSLR